MAGNTDDLYPEQTNNSNELLEMRKKLQREFDERKGALDYKQSIGGGNGDRLKGTERVKSGVIGGISRIGRALTSPKIKQAFSGQRVAGVVEAGGSKLSSLSRGLQRRVYDERERLQGTPAQMRSRRVNVVANIPRMVYPQIKQLGNRPFGTTESYSNTGYSQGKSGKKPGGGRGRPKGSYKHYDPSGKPISVFQFRKLQSARNAAKKYAQYSQANQYQQTAYARPQQVGPYSRPVMQQQFQQQQFQQPQVQQLGNIPQNRVPGLTVNNQPLQNSYEYYEDTDLMTGQRRLVRRPQPEAWTR